jgi:fatty acid desaturase
MRNFLKMNEHPAERAARLLVGVVLVGLAATGVIGAWGYIGMVPILTGLLGSCPIYTLAGISTCPISQSKR